MARRSAASFRRQLLPWNLSRWPWCISRSSSGVTTTTSPRSVGAKVSCSKASALRRRQIPKMPPTPARQAAATARSPEHECAQDQKSQCVSIVQGPSAYERDGDNGVPRQHMACCRRSCPSTPSQKTCSRSKSVTSVTSAVSLRPNPTAVGQILVVSWLFPGRFVVSVTPPTDRTSASAGRRPQGGPCVPPPRSP